MSAPPDKRLVHRIKIFQYWSIDPQAGPPRFFMAGEMPARSATHQPEARARAVRCATH